MKEAASIARKPDAKIEKKRKYDSAIIRHEGQIIARYGIRRSSHDVSHSYVPRQIHVSPAEAESLARCSLGKDDYFNILREHGVINA